jgi:hypothetical protein
MKQEKKREEKKREEKKMEGADRLRKTINGYSVR